MNLLRLGCVWCVVMSACSKKSEPAAAEVRAVEKDATTFLCARDGERHPANEIGYGWPDAVFSTGLREAEKERFLALQNEDLMVVGEGHFVRGWAPFRIEKRSEPWGLGFWVRVSPEDFAVIKKAGNVTATFTGTIANQVMFGAPTLGLAVRLEPGGAGARPKIYFTAVHPLTTLQKSIVTEETWRMWLTDAVHLGEPEPYSAPGEGTLETTGWSIYEPDVAGKTPFAFDKPPAKDDTVKVMMAVRVSDVNGNPMTYNAGWWVRVDNTARRDLWSGTLASDVHVEATIRYGSRLWFKPGQVVQYAPAE